MEQDHLISFKIKLQNFGALRPEAWDRIIQNSELIELNTGESFNRKEGTIAYLYKGLLKEYNPQHRKKPSIINFISNNQFLITRKHNQVHYLKACMPTHILYWEWESQQLLYKEFEELKKIYDYICTEYDDGIAWRSFLLELPVKDRIFYFRNTYKRLIPYLKKKDVSNYLHISYNHLLNNW